MSVHSSVPHFTPALLHLGLLAFGEANGLPAPISDGAVAVRYVRERKLEASSHCIGYLAVLEFPWFSHLWYATSGVETNETINKPRAT